MNVPEPCHGLMWRSGSMKERSHEKGLRSWVTERANESSLLHTQEKRQLFEVLMLIIAIQNNKLLN